MLRLEKALFVVVLSVLALVTACHRSAAGTSVTDLDGGAVDPLAATSAAAVVLVFVSTECPISNRYAPELQRLQAAYAPRGVAFHLVYPLASEQASAVRAHVREYRYSFSALRDPAHVLVARAGVSTTPEVAVFDRSGKVAYRGRIDDRQVSYGTTRSEPFRHDLELALDAVLAARPVETPVTTSIGCAIPPLR